MHGVKWMYKRQARIEGMENYCTCFFKNHTISIFWQGLFDPFFQDLCPRLPLFLVALVLEVVVVFASSDVGSS